MKKYHPNSNDLPMLSSKPDPGKLLVTLHIDIDRFILCKPMWRLSTWQKPEIACISAKDRLTCKISMAIPTFVSTRTQPNAFIVDIVRRRSNSKWRLFTWKRLKLPVYR